MDKVEQRRPEPRALWIKPELKRLEAGSAEAGGTSSQDGTDPGTNLS
jgi:hypothetical protein